MKQSLILILLITMVTSIKAQDQVNIVINQKAPVLQVKEVFINATPQKVWEVLINIADWQEWNNRISNSNLEEELKVGTTFTWEINGSKIKSKIHTCKKKQVLGWTGKAFGASAIHNWFIEPTDSGTMVRVEESMEGWIIKLMKTKMNKKLGDDMQYWLEQLKVESEK